MAHSKSHELRGPVAALVLAIAACVIASGCEGAQDEGYLPGAWYCEGSLDGGAFSELFVIQQSGSSVSLNEEPSGDAGPDYVSVSCTASGSSHVYSCPVAGGLTATFTLGGSPQTSLTVTGCTSKGGPGADGGSSITPTDAGCSDAIHVVMDCSEERGH